MAIMFGSFSWSTCIAFILLFMRKSNGDLSYSISEEMKQGSVIGNIAKDLGLKMYGLLSRNARLDTEEHENRFCEINLQKGEFIVA